MHKYWVVFLTFVLFNLTACETMKRSPDTMVTVTTKVGDEAIRAVVMQYEAAVNSGNLDDLMSLYAGNAVQAAPNEPAINGAQAIRMRADSNHQILSYNLASEISDIQVSGQLATARMFFKETMISKMNASDTTTASGVWVLLLQQEPDGNWKIATEIWNDERPIQQVN